MIKPLDELTKRFLELGLDARLMRIWDKLATRVSNDYQNRGAKNKRVWDKFLTIVGKMDEAQLEEVEKFMRLVKTYGAEADALYTRIDKSAVKAEEYIRNNPPSPGAIVLLVTNAQLAMKLEQARKGASSSLAIDPRQNEKAFVRECWNGWQKRSESYKSKADFARDMLSKCEHLASQKKIEDWCREWEKETSTQLAE